MTNSDVIMCAIAETDYIHRIDPSAPGPDFNNDPDCFRRYCEMQACGMDKKGLVLLAANIREYVKSEGSN